ncbi:MAG: hypothetical protein IT278_10710 [Ignavibacteriaceae bacterium]|jgi:flagellar biosynthesis protein FliP|nr:hypothetical protein [Ignavibacteriaceae bacterium]
MPIIGILKIVHIISAGLWLSLLVYGIVSRGRIAAAKGTNSEKSLILNWISSLNLIGIIGSLGVLLTGLYLTIVMDYGFFKFASGGNHWLYTKQFMMVIILILVGAVMIPTAKKIKAELIPGLKSDQPLTEEAYKLLGKLKTVDLSINVLIILNTLMAFSRYFTK